MRLVVTEKRFGNGMAVLKDVTLEVTDGQFVAVLGASGAGKTTLLRIIAGLDRDFTGIREVPERIGFVFQEPRLLPWRTVGENIRLVLPERSNGQDAVRASLAAVGLDGYAASYPRSLSGGQARRVALARALASNAQLLLLDEPFVSLDESAAESLRALLHELWRQRRMRVVLVTHDISEAARLGQRIVVLAGSPASIAADFVQHPSPAELRPTPNPTLVLQIQRALGQKP